MEYLTKENVILINKKTVKDMGEILFPLLIL